MSSILRSVPSLRIRVDGAPLVEVALRAVRAVRVRQRSSRPALCELLLHGLAPSAIDAARLRPGAALRLEVGSTTAALFDGEIVTAQEHFAGGGAGELRLRAYDWLHRLRKRQPLRVHGAADAIELARALLAADDLAVDAHAPGGGARVHVQFRQSDHDLLEVACAEAGLHFALSERRVTMFAGEGSGSAVTLRLGAEVHELVLEQSHEPACGEVVATGVEAASGLHHRSVVTEARAANDPREATGLAATWTLAGEWFADEAGARGLAQAERDRRAALAAAFAATVDGDAALRPGVAVAVEGVPGYQRVTAVLHGVLHRIDAESGYVCELDSRPPDPPLRRWSPVVALGIVSDVDDPDDHGRVRVRLPAFENLEVGWLAVIVPGGGSDKGMCALPDREDVVVVMFPREDLAHGFVLGGLYGTGPLPQPLSAKPRVRGFALRTGRGQTVHLDDDGDRVRVEDATGSFIELSPTALVVEAAVDLRIRAPGKTVLIAADRIDFERA